MRKVDIKKDRAFVGDIVVTKYCFKPVNKADELVDMDHKIHKGIIVSRSVNKEGNAVFGVRFGLGLEFTNHLNGLLSKPIGCFLERKDFEIEAED